MPRLRTWGIVQRKTAVMGIWVMENTLQVMRRWQAMQTLDSRLCSSFSQVFLTMQWWPLMCIAAHSTILGGTQETFSINLRNERFDLRLFPWGICFLLVDGQGKEKYLNKRNELSLSPPFPCLLWMDLINCPQGNAQLWIPFGAVKSCSTQSLPFPMTWAAYLYLCDVNTYCISGKTTNQVTRDCKLSFWWTIRSWYMRQERMSK